ncbi:MAG: hypothetical protein WCB57_10250 [Pseudonocardiaceae bacterium]
MIFIMMPSPVFSGTININLERATTCFSGAEHSPYSDINRAANCAHHQRKFDISRNRQSFHFIELRLGNRGTSTNTSMNRLDKSYLDQLVNTRLNSQRLQKRG